MLWDVDIPCRQGAEVNLLQDLVGLRLAALGGTQIIRDVVSYAVDTYAEQALPVQSPALLSRVLMTAFLDIELVNNWDIELVNNWDPSACRHADIHSSWLQISSDVKHSA